LPALKNINYTLNSAYFLVLTIFAACNLQHDDQNKISEKEIKEVISKLIQDSSIQNLLIDSSSAQFYNKQAVESYKAGNYLDAIANINIAIEKDRYNSEFYFNRGVFYQSLNNLDSALLDMQKTAVLNPKKWEAILQMSYLKYMKDDYKNALIDVERAIEINPKAGYAYFLRGELKKLSGNKKGACEDWAIAQQLGEPDATIKVLVECN